jgi:hypothetical protein
MIDNRILARDLRARGLLPIACDPDAIASPQPTRVQWDRVEGMLLGLAIGDALGNTSESMPPAERVACHGEIRDYLPNRFAMSRRVGLPSDDTQLALWTLERLARDGGLDPARLSDDFSDGRVIFGLGSSVREFLRRRKAGVPWERAGAESAGNGALMRIAPVLVPHLGVPSTALWADAALAGAITHRDAASIASCVAFIRVLWEVLQLAERPRPGWFVETFCETARQVEGDDPRYESRAPAFQGRRVALWSFARDLVSASSTAPLRTRRCLRPRPAPAPIHSGGHWPPLAAPPRELWTSSARRPRASRASPSGTLPEPLAPRARPGTARTFDRSPRACAAIRASSGSRCSPAVSSASPRRSAASA